MLQRVHSDIMTGWVAYRRFMGLLTRVTSRFGMCVHEKHCRLAWAESCVYFGRFTSPESPRGSRWNGQALLGREAENAW